MSDPAPVDTMTAEQAMAEIAAHRAGPVSSLPSDERMTALYQRAHAVSAPVALAPEAATAIKDKIAALRTEIAAEKGDTPRQRELVAQMEEQYKRLHSEPAAAVDDHSGAPEIEPDGADYGAAREAVRVMSEQPGALRWDSEELAYVRAAFRAHLPASDLTDVFQQVLPVVQGALRRIAAGAPTDEAILREEWGGEYDAQRQAEDAAWQLIPATQQVALRQHRVIEDLDFRRMLAYVGARLRGVARTA